MTAIKKSVKIPKYPLKHWGFGVMYKYTVSANYTAVVSEHLTLWITDLSTAVIHRQGRGCF